MRYLTLIVVSFIVLIAAGSIYLYIDTKRFIENSVQPPRQDTTPPEGSPSLQNQLSEHTVPPLDTPSTPPTQRKNGTEPVEWWDDGADAEQTHAHGDASKQNQTSDIKEEESVNWLDLTTPYERADALRASLLRQFGDVPEVDAVVEGFLNVWTQTSMDTAERLRFNRALNTFWPAESTQKVIEYLETGKLPTHTQPSGPFLNLRHQFPDFEPFVAEYGFEAGVLRFAEQNPERALEFKRALWQTHEVQSRLEEMSEEARRFFKEITSQE